jgi:Recombination endonuclease VII
MARRHDEKGRFTRVAEPGFRHCYSCRTIKPLADFNSDASMPEGKGYLCKVCAVAKQRAARQRNPIPHRAEVSRWRHKNPELRLEHFFKYKYGLPRGGYAALLQSQGGLCAICREPPAEGKRLCVDHCHETNAVRGLLCNSCNTAIGHLRHSEALLLAAIKYLAKSSAI